jgi:hypothetical protein
MPKPRSRKLTYAFLATIPIGILVGSGLMSKRGDRAKKTDPKAKLS